MIKRILVATDGSKNGNAACTYAFNLAQTLQADCQGIHVIDERMLEGPLFADISGWLGAEAYSAQISQFYTLMEEKADAIAAAFALTFVAMLS